MDEIKIGLKTLVDGLKSFSKVIEVMAERVDTFAENISETNEETADVKVKKPASAKKKAPKSKPAKASGKITAIEQIHQAILNSETSISGAELSEQTGINIKGIHDIVYKLKKRNLIKSPKPGSYETI